MLLNEVVSKRVDGKMRRGHHTFKKYHLSDKLPKFITKFINADKFIIEEESWNFVAVGHTVYTNPNYMADDFFITVESTNLDDDYGNGHNPLELSDEDLAIRKVIFLDIANDEPNSQFYKTHYNDEPTACHFTESGKEPLKPDWLKSYRGPIMTVYKLVRTYFKWYGLQTWIENKIVSDQQDYLLIFHRKLYCLMDEWFEMTYDELEEVEAETIEELRYLRQHGGKRGIGTRVQPSAAVRRRKRKESKKAEDSVEQAKKLEEAPKEEAGGERQLSLISRWMRPAVGEVIDGSRHLIIIRGFQRDLVLTLPALSNDEAQEKIANEKDD